MTLIAIGKYFRLQDLTLGRHGRVRQIRVILAHSNVSIGHGFHKGIEYKMNELFKIINIYIHDRT